MRTLFAPHALLPEGWANNVQIEIDGHGNIAAVTVDAQPGRAEHVGGALIPGMPNVHSHAFQRAMAGRTERRSAAGDDFWSWRELMYRFVERLGPKECNAIAAQLYVELLRSGFTAVGEFHYLHRDAAGNAYADPAELVAAHTQAAKEAGIAITILPALYGFGAMGGAPLEPAQRRFASTPESILRLLEVLRRHFQTERDVRFGVAPHSLRAVTAATLNELLSGIGRIDPTAPIHMHVAEQHREVSAAIAQLGARPIEWLLANMPLDNRWCLIHCTHATRGELEGLRRANAVVGICPTTEANLGDGIFDLPGLQAEDLGGAAFGIGTDSHVNRSATQELRLLEYTQRLITHRRTVGASTAQPSTGAQLWTAAVKGGTTALGRKAGAIATGMRADLVVLSLDTADAAGIALDELLDAFVFSGGDAMVKHVAVSGRWVIRDGHHRDEQTIAERYRRAVHWLSS